MYMYICKYVYICVCVCFGISISIKCINIYIYILCKYTCIDIYICTLCKYTDGSFFFPREQALSHLHPVLSLSEDAVSASLDPETLLRQLPAEPISKGMAGPSEAQLFQKLKGDAIPWVVTLLLVLPVVAASKSLVPAVVVGLIDLCWFIYNYVQAQEMNSPSKPEPVSRGLVELWEKCLTESPDGPEDFVVGWFYDAPLSTIAREDVEVWLAWGCFSTTPEMLVPESKLDVLRIFALIEMKLDYHFPLRAEGQAPVSCMRFSIEPIEWTHKPFVFYAVCQGVLGSLGMLSLWGEGFSRHRSGVFDYWVRMPATEEGRQRTPIVFVVRTHARTHTRVNVCTCT